MRAVRGPLNYFTSRSVFNGGQPEEELSGTGHATLTQNYRPSRSSTRVNVDKFKKILIIYTGIYVQLTSVNICPYYDTTGRQ